MSAEEKLLVGRAEEGVLCRRGTNPWNSDVAKMSFTIRTKEPCPRSRRDETRSWGIRRRGLRQKKGTERKCSSLEIRACRKAKKEEVSREDRGGLAELKQTGGRNLEKKEHVSRLDFVAPAKKGSQRNKVFVRRKRGVLISKEKGKRKPPVEKRKSNLRVSE